MMMMFDMRYWRDSMLDDHVVNRLCNRRDIATLTFLESRWNPSAKRETPRERSYGLGQINIDVHSQYDVVKLLDANYNLDVTETIYDYRKGDPALKYGYYNGGGPSNKRIPHFRSLFNYLSSIDEDLMRSYIKDPLRSESIILREAQNMGNKNEGNSGVKVTIARVETSARDDESQLKERKVSGGGGTQSESSSRNFMTAVMRFFSNPGKTVAEVAIKLNTMVIESKWAPDFVRSIMKRLNSLVDSGAKMGDGMLFTILLVVASLGILLRIRPVVKFSLDLFEKLGGMAWAAKNKGGTLGTAVWILLTVFMKILKALNRALTFSFNPGKDAQNVWKGGNFDKAAPTAARAMDWGLDSKLGSLREPVKFVRSVQR